MSLPRPEAGHLFFRGCSPGSAVCRTSHYPRPFPRNGSLRGGTMNGLTNKRVLITGHCLATARRFACEEANVLVTDVVADEILLGVQQEFQERHLARVFVENLDVTREDEVGDQF